jgi:Hemerythrin HHE cation binding domain
MDVEAPMTGHSPTDVIDVLLGQHEQVRQLLVRAREADGAERHRLVGELARVVRAHESGEQVVIYPTVCDRTPGGTRVAVACLTEGYQVARALAEMRTLTAEHPSYQVRLAAVTRAFLNHAAHEEAGEFPALRRYVPTERLHRMAHELRHAQSMS